MRRAKQTRKKLSHHCLGESLVVRVRLGSVLHQICEQQLVARHALHRHHQQRRQRQLGLGGLEEIHKRGIERKVVERFLSRLESATVLFVRHKKRPHLQKGRGDRGGGGLPPRHHVVERHAQPLRNGANCVNVLKQNRNRLFPVARHQRQRVAVQVANLVQMLAVGNLCLNDFPHNSVARSRIGACATTREHTKDKRSDFAPPSTSRLDDAAVRIVGACLPAALEPPTANRPSTTPGLAECTTETSLEGTHPIRPSSVYPVSTESVSSVTATISPSTSFRCLPSVGV
jgi:hypothetical protein